MGPGRLKIWNETTDTWDYVAPGIEGATGPQGPTGATGPQGATGASGVGNVVGPASATSNSIVVFDGATGKLLRSQSKWLLTTDSAPDDMLLGDSGTVVQADALAGRIAVITNNIHEWGDGSGVTIDGALIKDGIVKPRIGTTTSSTTITPTAASYDQYNVTALAVNTTIASAGTGVEGQKLILRIKDNGTSRTLTWNAIYAGTTGAALPTATTAGKTLLLGFIYDSALVKWVLVAKTETL